MVTNISINMGYNNNPYVIMPLNKTRDDGMAVASSINKSKVSEECMDNLKDIKAADTDNNGMISLKELENFEGKTEFAQALLGIMEKYSQNYKYQNSRGYVSKSLV